MLHHLISGLGSPTVQRQNPKRWLKNKTGKPNKGKKGDPLSSVDPSSDQKTRIEALRRPTRVKKE